ncbi:TetR family transcriptional regulator [Rothia sp. HC945]|uniref:TetR/AcrR family transcriptional regulator n=1 Tax=Rothia sp. HC945 TaxID=3171170 RepID=UPI002650FC7D|nr:TetR family transcriptional regulator [Kocuria sp.]
MALTRERILETALSLLSDYGLGDLSMRRLATELGVAPGALYYHVRNKQELLTRLAGRMLGPTPDVSRIAPEDSPHAQKVSEREVTETVVELARTARESVLRYQDGADVIGIALVADQESVSSFVAMRETFERGAISPTHADWAARTVLHTVLGFVSTEHNRLRLEASSVPADDSGARSVQDARACEFGVRAVIRGVLDEASEQ